MSNIVVRIAFVVGLCIAAAFLLDIGRLPIWRLVLGSACFYMAAEIINGRLNSKTW